MKRKLIAWLLIVTTSASMILTSGCAAQTQVENEATVEVTPMEKEEVAALSYDFIGGKDVMPIGGFYGPHTYNYCYDGNELPDPYSDEVWTLIKESGVNIITYMQSLTHYSMHEVYKMLELCDKYGIGLFTIDAALFRDYSSTQIAERIAQQMQYKSYCGIHLVDEPATSYFKAELGEDRYISAYKHVADMMHLELELDTYSNLLPINLVELKAEYERYVDEYIDTLNPEYLMWDEYPFNKYYGGNMQAYILAMSIICKKAKENNLPFWTSIQVGDQWGLGPVESETPYWPNEAQFTWNISTGLAYGIKGLQYYTLFGHAPDLLDADGGLEPYRASIIGVAGNKTQWYYYAQKVNKHIAAIDHVLMNSAHKGVLIKGEQIKKDFTGAYEVLKGEKFQELQSIVGDEVMVGCFNYNGKTALYVVNYDQEYAQKITLNLNARHNVTAIQQTETSYVNAKTLTLDMAAGEGVLLVIE